MKLTDLYWFLGTFIVIYLLYFFFQILKTKEFDKDKVPIELLLLIKKYHLDMDKINYRYIMHQIALVSAFDIAFIATFEMKFVNNIFLSIIIGGLLFIPLIFITYSFIGIYYVKKGKTKNGYKKN